MKIQSVHIPIFCDSEEHRYGALLTLKTIRVGFPTIEINVHWSYRSDWLDGCKSVRLEIGQQCNNIGAKLSSFEETNDKIIKKMIDTEEEPFAVVDSDVVFYENCEDYTPGDLIAGEYIPEFVCPIAKAITKPRLHTAFFVVSDPVKLRRAIELTYRPAFPKFCPFDPFAPVVVFEDTKPVFYDSCAVLYQAIGGEKFEDDMLRRFEHLHGGSYMNGQWAERIKAAYDNPESARGTRAMMTRYFEEMKP